MMAEGDGEVKREAVEAGAGSSAARTPAQTPKPQNWPGPAA